MNAIKNSIHSDPYLLLNTIIEREIANLKVYANKPDSKDIVIEFRNKLIEELLEVLRSLKEFKFHETWLLFEYAFYEARIKDPKINSFIIRVKLNEEKDNPFHYAKNLN